MDVFLLGLAIVVPCVLLALGVGLVVHRRQTKHKGKRRKPRDTGVSTADSMNHIL